MDIVELFCSLVVIDSESGEEERFIEHLREVLERELGAEAETDSYGNLIGRIEAKGSTAPPIALAAHADTVKPGKGIEPIVEGGTIRSKGETILGADDKAGIAEIIAAVKGAERHPPLEIVITRGEEVGLLGARNLDLSRVKSERAFIVDGEELNEVITGGPTHISFDLTITGRAAHAGMEPEKGISAIRVAAEAIANLREGRIDHETTANIGIIEGGLIRNGVPEKATVKGECRSLNHEKALKQMGSIRAAFEEAAGKAGAGLKFEERVEYEAFSLPEGAEIVKIALEAIKSAGLTPVARPVTGGTDALILANRGLEAVVLGFGGEGAHTTDERIAVADLVKGSEIIRNLIESLA